MVSDTLYYGDNLDILGRYVKDETVDLIYLDPPFKSNQDYNVLFDEQNGARSKAQIKAFEDTWRWDQDAAEAFVMMVEAGGKLSRTMQAFRMILGENDMLAYLCMMAPRLLELRRVLKSSGSIYLHCDPTAGAHLRILMDAIFGPRSFRNEIVWSYRRWPSPARHFQRMHDVILFYSKSPDGPGVFNVDYEEGSASYQKRFKGKTQLLDPETKTRKITLDADSKGLLRRDVWEISIVAGSSRERMGYPTQKPEKLLERIILAGSNEGDLILDPFCGCGTAVAVAQRLKRRWIGIDITHLAVTLIKHRLQASFGDQTSYQVIGEPVSPPDAELLAQEDPYQFQYWALGLVGARPVETKKGADRGIDGRLYFHDDPKSGQTRQIVISVKSGRPGVAHLRDLRGVLDREKADIGVLITLREPTRAMKKEAASTDFYRSPWGSHPRLQILTIEDLLSGKRINYPPARQVNATFKKGKKNNHNSETAVPLPFAEEESELK